MQRIKKLVNIVLVVVVLYLLYQGAVWGYNRLRNHSMIERGAHLSLPLAEDGRIVANLPGSAVPLPRR